MAMEVLFAPDWRDGVPYQRLLAAALAAAGVRVDFLTHYRRVLPLTRLLQRRRPELLHLHWPEAYYPTKHDGWDLLRRARFAADLALATRRTPLVFTAHNLAEHNLRHAFARANYTATCRHAQLIFAHSAAARAELIRVHGCPAEKIRVIPHGDLSVALPPPPPRDEARAALGLPAGARVGLMFGAVEPYKGQEEMLAHWRRARPNALLVIAGKPHTPEYGQSLRRAAAGMSNVIFHFKWLADSELAQFLSAADVALFNYRTIFTSGAACLARSWGLPILLPARLTTVDLAEPDPRVLRFQSLETDFAERLAAALAITPDHSAAAPWRAATSWERVAEFTAAAYREVL